MTVEYWSGFCNIYLVYSSKLQFFSLTNTGTIKANNLVTTILPGLQAGVPYDLLSVQVITRNGYDVRPKGKSWTTQTVLAMFVDASMKHLSELHLRV